MTGLHISQIGAHPFSGQDIRSLFEHQAVVRRDHPFLIWCPFTGEEQVWTYGEFRRALNSFIGSTRSRRARGRSRDDPCR